MTHRAAKRLRGWVVTPTLFLGQMPPWPDAVRTSTPEGALFLINCGMTAVLPEGHWDVAAETLSGLGLDGVATRRLLERASPCSY